MIIPHFRIGISRWFPAAIVVAALAFPSGALGSNGLLQRFFPVEAVSRPPPQEGPALPPPPVRSEVDVDRHNQGVSENNNGVEAMNGGDFRSAADYFSKAVELDPNETAFLNNLLVAQKKMGGRPREAIETARKIMAMDPADHKAAYTAGTIFLDLLKSPKESLPYFFEAHRRGPKDPNTSVALASALERSGYPDAAIDLLKENAHLIADDPYPMYLLGMLLLGKKDYPTAIRSLNSALPLDKEGFVHDAYIRARFYAGQLDGLREFTEGTLQRFPGIINRPSLERILFALVPHRYRLVETVNVQVGDRQCIKKLDFLVRLPGDVPGHQQVALEEAVITCGGETGPVAPTGPDNDGRMRFAGPTEPQSNLIQLRMTFAISTQPWLGSRGPFFNSAEPSLDRLREDERLGLDHPMVEAIGRELKTMPGNFLQNAFLAVGSGLKYTENFRDESVEWALSNPDSCDCTEFSLLLASLCLKRGTPARVTTGFLVKSEFLNKETNIGHAWCEVYFKGKGWIPVDPTLGSTMQWAYFGNLLSDQINFDTQEPGRRARVSVDFTSTSSSLQMNISNGYFITLDDRN